MSVWAREMAVLAQFGGRQTAAGKRNWSLTGTAAFRLIAGLLLAAVVMQAIVLLIVLPSGPWDDAYMFVRYANNLLQHGTIAWNPDGAPTYWLTSLLFLVVVVPLRMVLGFNPYAVATSASLVCGIGFIVLLTVLVHRHVGASQFERRVALLIVYLAFAISAVPLAIHPIDGMDTTFAMTYLTAYILAVKWHERLPRPTTTACVGVLGRLAFSVRPDLR